LALAIVAIAFAPLPPWMFSTTNVPPMTRVKCGTISRRNTSLPPPGLECVTSATTPPLESFARAHAVKLATAITTATRRIRPLTPESLAHSLAAAKARDRDTTQRFDRYAVRCANLCSL
jgi:hypothetical protein